MKFKIGEIIVGNRHSDCYAVTNSRSGRWRVTKIINLHEVMIEHTDARVCDEAFPVNSLCFDLYVSLPNNFIGKTRTGGSL